MRASAPAGCSPRAPGGVKFTPPGAFSFFAFERVVLIAFAEPISASLGCGGLDEVAKRGPLASAWSERFVRGPPDVGYVPHASFRSEGGVECAMLPLMGVSVDTFGELLSGSPSGGLSPVR